VKITARADVSLAGRHRAGLYIKREWSEYDVSPEQLIELAADRCVLIKGKEALLEQAKLGIVKASHDIEADKSKPKK
jgi:hypothetical protein